VPDKKRHSLHDLPGQCGFVSGGLEPNDSVCPVTRYRPEFVPSRLIDEAMSGWFPTLIRHCIGCELCSPDMEHSFANCADKLLLQGGVREDYMPRAFSGALDAIVSIQLRNEGSQNRLGWIGEGLKIKAPDHEGKVALFVGNTPYLDSLLGDEIGYYPTDESNAAIELLNSVGVEPVVLPDEVDCGRDRLHAGDRAAFIALGTRNRDLLRERGVKTIVTTCDDVRYTLGTRYPGRIPDWDFEVVRLADFLVSRGGKLAFMPTRETVAIQPPDIYSDPGGNDAVRELLKRIPELIVKTMAPGMPSTFGSWNQFDSYSKLLETDYLRAAEATSAPTLLVSGTTMLVRLLEGRRPGSWEETSIKIKGFYRFLSERHTVAEEFAGA